MMRMLLFVALLVVSVYSQESEDGSWEEVIPEEIMNINSEEIDNDIEVFGDVEFLKNPDSLNLEDIEDFAGIREDSDSEDDIVEFSEELGDIDELVEVDEIEDIEDMDDVEDVSGIDDLLSRRFGRRGDRGFYKRGSCPEVESRNVTDEANETETESCEDQCTNNFDCSGRSLCCDSGCGNVCTLPEVRFCTIKNVRIIAGRRIYMKSGRKLATCQCNRGNLKCKNSRIPFLPRNPANDLTKLIRNKRLRELMLRNAPKTMS